MADTTPRNNIISNDIAIKALNNEIILLNNQIEKQGQEIFKRQTALIRIYNIFDESMHPCKLVFNTEGRMAWMQEIARVASATVVNVKQVIDKPTEPTNVKPLKIKKSAKIVGVGQAGEKSGI